MFVRDIMSFFFVLSGFVMMHSHYSDDFQSMSHKWNFWYRRWTKIYPTYMLNLTFYIPLLISRATSDDRCAYSLFCYLLQVFFLNSWAGCGLGILNPLSWYLGTLVWMWLLFPSMHCILKRMHAHNAWIKMLFVNVLSTGVLFFVRDYNMFAICTLPVLRLGEFVIGCGAACVLNQQKQQAAGSLTVKHWIPMLLSLLYLWTAYIFLGMPHWMSWLCLHEEIDDTRCGLWHRSRWIEEAPPCHVVWDKYFNKHALIWAIIIYTVAYAETVKNASMFMNGLGHDIFKSVNSFSLSLYLSHDSVSRGLKEITDGLGWSNFWRADVLLLVVYFACYILHILIAKINSLFFGFDSSTLLQQQHGETEHVELLPLLIDTEVLGQDIKF